MRHPSKRWHWLAFSLWAAASAASSAPAASPLAEVKVMVLATYHFGNPGQDAVNLAVDDVLSPKRQAELQTLTRRLVEFRPHKVMVERRPAAPDRPELPSYQAWRQGERRAQRNEVEQLGFRLAEARGHEQAYGVDADGNFPFEPLQDYARQRGMEARLQAMLAVLQQGAKDFEVRQARHSIAELLAELNRPEALLRDHQFYTEALHFGHGDNQPGAELLGQWYTRNARICARVVQLARPGERIVVVYGSGHAYLLRQCVLEQPGWRLVEALPYLLGQ
ncbi:MAG: hypothetical protein IV092_05315 [Burkholderiaceae bacterium]|nr:hypothetical protein [Burkholderiaceae bacterium]